MARKKTKSKSDDPVPFEQSLEQLKQIVAQLENGNLSLSESLQHYEQGVANLKRCFESLNAAQRKIEMLVDLDEDGNLVTRSFDNTASAQMAEGSRRKSRAKPVVEMDQDMDDDDDEDEDMDDPNSLF